MHETALVEECADESDRSQLADVGPVGTNRAAHNVGRQLKFRSRRSQAPKRKIPVAWQKEQ